MRRRRLASFLLSMLPLLSCTTGQAAAAADPSKPERSELLAFGAEAPEIAGLVLNGERGTKLSQFRGRVVVVDFWATWCAPCLQAMPELDAMRSRLHELGWADRFEVVGVNVDSDIPKARQFLERIDVGYPVIGDPIGIAMKRWGPWKLPATFLLDAEGHVQMIWLGYADYFAADIQAKALEQLRLLDKPATAASVQP